MFLMKKRMAVMTWYKNLFAVTALVGLMTAAAEAQNLLQNSDFETGSPANWTVTGATEWQDGDWFGSATYHSATHFVGVANNGGHASGTVWQSAGLPFGATTYNLTLSFWALLFDIGGDPDTITGQIVVDSTVVASVAMTHADGLDTYVYKQVSWTGQVNTEIKVNFLLEADGHSQAGNWGVVCLDDAELTGGGAPTQHTINSIDPELIADNSADTPATITGTNLDGVTATKLVQGATELAGTNIVVAPDGLSLTTDFPTSGAPFGVYDVVVEKTGNTPATLVGGFRIRDPNGSFLVNGGFEEGDLTGWDTWYSDWGGNPVIDHVYVAGSGDLFIHTPKVDDVATPVVEGDYSFRAGEYRENGGEGGVYQQVPVFPGEELALAFQWGGGNTQEDSAMEIGVLKGEHTTAWQYPPEDVLGLVRYENPDEFGWESSSITFTVPAGEDRITVYTKVWHYTAGLWNYVALWTDGMTLSRPQCPNQHELTSINPTSHDANSEMDLTVYGSNMDQVTAIRLVRGQDQIVGTITSAGFGSLTAHFVPPPGGATLGNYDVVTEQEGCLGRTLEEAFTYFCEFPSTLTGVEPASLVKPQSLVQMTVSGTNVDLLDRVKLVYTPEPRNPPGDRAPYWVPISEATGTVLDASNPSAVVMQFDLYNAQAGKYKLVGERDDVCGNANEVLDALELLLPDGDSVVVNGGFEEINFEPWVLTPEEGFTTKGEPMPGAELVFAPGTGPDPWYNHYSHGGEYMVGIRSTHDGTWENWLTPNRGYLTQSVGLPNGTGQYEIVATCWVRMWDQQPGGCSLTASIIIDEGAQVSSVTAELVDLPFMTVDGLDPYTRLSVDYIGAADSDITIEFYLTTSAQGPGWGTPSSVVIDDIELLGTLTCNSPFADVDGDGDVDQSDFGILQRCITGSGFAGDLPQECRCLDHDSNGQADGSIDQYDIGAFEECATGPAVLHPDYPNP